MRHLPCLIALAAAPACAEVLDLPELHRGDCSPDAAFTHIAPVPGLAHDLVQAAQLTSDELTIVFSRATLAPTPRYGDLYLAHRARVGDPFGDARALDEVNTEFDELGASLSDDLRTLYFDREDRDRAYRILVATRASADEPFGPATAVDLGDDTTSNFEPFRTADGLYFGSTRGNGIASLFEAWGSGPAFGAPLWLGSLEAVAAPTAYENPVPSADGLTIYFGAEPTGARAKDIWVAHRSSPGARFDPPRLVTALNTDAFENPSWLSPDGCHLYFMTDRAGAAELWLASRRD